ncbi:PAS domain-containing protein [Paeniroseomonas aquatica]|uniref:histidine kinase n=1 Tax=Paeniroseomonas aquatica TaxID=373043 RepID=A0ABT8AEA2_9PROT|nr:PAS domain-containing protein [Paeniroseomonas aquatica]MDN3568144.1 PAS domain-containing protein [Paeniroseomonas aquatica]
MSPDRRRLSLRTLLLLLVVTVALPLTALAGLAVWHAHNQARGRAEAEVLGQARTMTALVDREIQRVETGLRALADSSALARGDLAAVDTEMRAMAAQLDGTAIGLGSLDGQLLSTTWPVGERRPQAPTPPAMHDTLTTGRSKVTNLVSSQNTGRLVVAVVVPVVGPSALAGPAPPEGSGMAQAPSAPANPTPRPRPRFAFAAALPEGRLAMALRERNEPGSEARIAAVIDRAGVVVARSVAEADYIGRTVHPDFARALANLPEGVLHDAPTYDGSTATFAFATAPRSGFTVALSLPESEFSAPLWRALRQVGLLAAAILAGGVALAAMLAGRIARALQRLTDSTVPERPILREVDDLAQAMAERDQAMERLTTSEHRFRALAKAGALVLWRSDADGGILDAEGWQALTGQSDTALRGAGWLAMLHPDDLARTLAAWENARQQDRPIDIEYRVRTSGGEWHWVRARAVPLRDGAQAVEWVGVVEDVDSHRQAALALADREERLRLAVSAARLTTWEYDPVADRGSRASATSEAIEAPVTSSFTLADWTASVHPDDRPATHALLQATIEGEIPEFIAEFRVKRRSPSQGWAWIATHGAVAARDPMTGAVLRLAGVSQDVSERREAEQRRILLAREVDHRAKNVLAVVQSVLRLTRRDQPETFVATVEARVAALARAHTLLAEEGWIGADLQVLAERETASCPPGSVVLEGPALAVAAAAVQPLAMVLHELATNAAKHGAASRLGGKVTLSWVVEDGFVELCWAEQGGPPMVEAPTRRGFGSRMIDAIVRGQLGGALTLAWRPAGLECRMRLPASRLLSAEALNPRRRATAPVA